MDDIFDTLGLMRRELRDVRTVASNIDHRTRNLTSPAAMPSSEALLSKALVCHAISGLRSKSEDPVSAAAVAAELYKNNYAVVGALAKPGMIGKAASAPAMTTVAGWAAEISGQGVSDRGFLQLLAPTSVYAQLSQRPNSIRVDLTGYGSIRIPTRSPSPTIGGSFVAQGQPYPIRQAQFSSVALTPKSMKVGSMITGEMLQYSLPNAETIITAIMSFDTAIALDSVLLDSNPATSVRPAGLLSGAISVTATAGGGLAAFAGDVRALASAIETSGPMLDPCLIMSATSELMIDTLSMSATDNLPIIASPNVPAKQLIMLDAANFASGEADEPKISSSKDALVHADDTSPLQIATPGSPATIAAPAISMFQTDCVVLALKQDLEWIMTRPARCAYITAVSW